MKSRRWGSNRRGSRLAVASVLTYDSADLTYNSADLTYNGADLTRDSGGFPELTMQNHRMWVLAICALFAACGSRATPVATSPGCVNGQTISCACPSAQQGVQTCASNAYGTCACPGADADNGSGGDSTASGDAAVTADVVSDTNAQPDVSQSDAVTSDDQDVAARPTDVHPDQTIKRLVDEIRAVIQDELGLPASAGIGTSHTIAKMASGRAKPAGTLMVRSGQELGFLAPLPVRKFPGVGPVAERKLHEAGLQTLGQVIRSAHAGGGRRFVHLARRLRSALEPTGNVKWKRERPAFREHDPGGVDVGSISNERTFSADVGDDQRSRDQLKTLAERVCWRARQRGIVARTVTLKLRYSDFKTITRGKTIPGTNDEGAVLRCITDLYEHNHQRRMAIRLLGVCLSNLGQQDRQLKLEFDGRPRPKIGHALDKVREQYGYDAIRLGSTGGPSRWLV